MTIIVSPQNFILICLHLIYLITGLIGLYIAYKEENSGRNYGMVGGYCILILPNAYLLLWLVYSTICYWFLK